MSEKIEKDLKINIDILSEEIYALKKERSEYYKLIVLAETKLINFKLQQQTLINELQKINSLKSTEDKDLRKIEIERLRSVMPELLSRLK